MTATDAPRDNVGRASALMASGSLVSRLLGVVRTSLMVACIGAETTASTAFNTANTLPNQIFALLQGGLLTTLILPQLTKAMARKDAGKQTIDALLTWSFVVILGVTVLATALAYPLSVVLRLQGPTLELGVTFAFICLPQIFFYGAYTLLSQVLYARGRFALTMWATVFANLVQISGMVIFLSRFGQVNDADRWTPDMVWLLAGVFTLGIVVQSAALIPALVRSGFSWRPSLALRGHGFRTTAKLAVWTMIAVTIAQLGGFTTVAAINEVTHRGLASGDGNVANVTVYNLAFMLFFVPHGIITISLLTAIFPRITRAYQAGDEASLRADVLQAIKLPLVGMVPITAAAIALAGPGIKVLNPKLTGLEIADTSLVFGLMALGLVPYAINGLQQRYSMAREDGRTNLWLTCVVVGVQVAAAIAILFIPSALGVAVVALGMTVGNALAAALFLGRLRAQVGLPLGALGRLGVRLLLASVPAGIAAAAVTVALASVLPVTWLSALLELAAGGLAFGVVFLGLARLLRLTEVTALLVRLPGWRRRRAA